ncbi:DUF2750 domain-containing protein [Micromonospora schwarzwaldensis]|uniref:DUF2750 domain-containing protein n=1 Tax=Micromonospora sp. DSM 45708 TaxID=3111767 RepID=UPI0031D0EF36
MAPRHRQGGHEVSGKGFFLVVEPPTGDPRPLSITDTPTSDQTISTSETRPNADNLGSVLLASRLVSQSGSQAAAFFREVAGHRTVWFVRDAQGSPAPKTSSGARAMPYWSSRARAQRAADIWGNDLRPVSVSLQVWRNNEC